MAWLKTVLFKITSWCVKLFQQFKFDNSLLVLNAGRFLSAILGFLLCAMDCLCDV